MLQDFMTAVEERNEPEIKRCLEMYSLARGQFWLETMTLMRLWSHTDLWGKGMRTARCNFSISISLVEEMVHRTARAVPGYEERICQWWSSPH